MPRRPTEPSLPFHLTRGNGVYVYTLLAVTTRSRHPPPAGRKKNAKLAQRVYRGIGDAPRHLPCGFLALFPIGGATQTIRSRRFTPARWIYFYSGHERTNFCLSSSLSPQSFLIASAFVSFSPRCRAPTAPVSPFVRGPRDTKQRHKYVQPAFFLLHIKYVCKLLRYIQCAMFSTALCKREFQHGDNS